MRFYQKCLNFTGSDSTNTNTFVGQGMKIISSLFDADGESLEGCAQFFCLHHGHRGHSTNLVHYTNHICYELLMQERTNRLSSTNPAGMHKQPIFHQPKAHSITMWPIQITRLASVDHRRTLRLP